MVFNKNKDTALLSDLELIKRYRLSHDPNYCKELFYRQCPLLLSKCMMVLKPAYCLDAMRILYQNFQTGLKRQAPKDYTDWITEFSDCGIKEFAKNTGIEGRQSFDNQYIAIEADHPLLQKVYRHVLKINTAPSRTFYSGSKELKYLIPLILLITIGLYFGLKKNPHTTETHPPTKGVYTQRIPHQSTESSPQITTTKNWIDSIDVEETGINLQSPSTNLLPIIDSTLLHSKPAATKPPLKTKKDSSKIVIAPVTTIDSPMVSKKAIAPKEEETTINKNEELLMVTVLASTDLFSHQTINEGNWKNLESIIKNKVKPILQANAKPSDINFSFSIDKDGKIGSFTIHNSSLPNTQKKEITKTLKSINYPKDHFDKEFLLKISQR